MIPDGGHPIATCPGRLTGDLSRVRAVAKIGKPAILFVQFSATRHRIVRRVLCVGRSLVGLPLGAADWSGTATVEEQGRTITMSKRTLQRSKLVRARRLGFRARMATRGGRKVLSARRRIGRARLSA